MPGTGSRVPKWCAWSCDRLVVWMSPAWCRSTVARYRCVVPIADRLSYGNRAPDHTLVTTDQEEATTHTTTTTEARHGAQATCASLAQNQKAYCTTVVLVNSTISPRVLLEGLTYLRATGPYN
jgi:hypothetical protein